MNNVLVVVIFENLPEYECIMDRLKRHIIFEKWIFDWENVICGFSRGVETDNCSFFSKFVVNILSFFAFIMNIIFFYFRLLRKSN
jgi:hypothetical protein